MKKSKINVVILGLALMLTSIAGINAQTGIFRDEIMLPDTIVAADTVYYELGLDRNAGDWPRLWEFSLVVTFDQVSGTNTGAYILQVSNDPPSDATPTWTELIDLPQDYSLTTASADLSSAWVGTLKHRRIRLAWLKSGTGTMSVAYSAAFKRNQ